MTYYVKWFRSGSYSIQTVSELTEDELARTLCKKAGAKSLYVLFRHPRDRDANVSSIITHDDGQDIVHYADGGLSLVNYCSKALADLLPDYKPPRRAD